MRFSMLLKVKKVLSSNDQNREGAKVFFKKGDNPIQVNKSAYRKCGIFNNISIEDAADFICDIDCARTALLERKK